MIFCLQSHVIGTQPQVPITRIYHANICKKFTHEIVIITFDCVSSISYAYECVNVLWLTVKDIWLSSFIYHRFSDSLHSIPSFNLSPSFFSQLTIVPASMVGDNAGRVTLVCDGKLLQYPRQKFTFHTDGCKFRLWLMIGAALKSIKQQKKITF